MIEVLVAAAAAGPPLHVHPAHAEGFYLLEGELLVQVRDELRTGRAGSSSSPRPGRHIRSPTAVSATRVCW